MPEEPYGIAAPLQLGGIPNGWGQVPAAVPGDEQTLAMIMLLCCGL
jgi:hypothetical protein